MDLFSRKILTCKFGSRVHTEYTCVICACVRVSIAVPRKYDGVMCTASYGVVRLHPLVAPMSYLSRLGNIESITNITLLFKFLSHFICHFKFLIRRISPLLRVKKIKIDIVIFLSGINFQSFKRTAFLTSAKFHLTIFRTS